MNNKLVILCNFTSYILHQMSTYLNHIKYIGSSKYFITNRHFHIMAYRQPDMSCKTIKYKVQEIKGENKKKLTLNIISICP